MGSSIKKKLLKFKQHAILECDEILHRPILLHPGHNPSLCPVYPPCVDHPGSHFLTLTYWTSRLPDHGNLVDYVQIFLQLPNLEGMMF